MIKKIIFWIRNNTIFSIVLFLSIISRLIFYFNPKKLWWDSAVYLGMGRFIFSSAKLGLWEPIRPILWPIITGLFYNVAQIQISRAITFIISILIIILVYSIAKSLFDSNTAIIASILVAFSSIFFFFTFRLYTEIPSLFFTLLALFFLIRKKNFLSGIFIGLAFLTRFPAGIFLICFLPFFYKQKNISKKIFLYFAGFAITILPYLIFNQTIYGNFIFPFVSASNIIERVVACNYTYYNPPHFYIIKIFKDNVFNIFLIPGIIYLLKNKDKKNILILFSFFIPLLYFTQLNCRAYRYMISFIPFIAMTAAIGIRSIRLKIIKKTNILIMIILLISSITAVNYYIENKDIIENNIKKQFNTYAQNLDIKNDIWITNPETSLYTNKRTKLLYYPLYTTEKIEYYIKHMNDTDYLFLDSCSGGMTCHPDDTECEKKTYELIASAKDMNLVYNRSINECKYYIFER